MPILKIQDIGLYYELTGEGSPLLFVHGLGSSTRDWENQIPYFSHHYKVITYDVRGHGKSDKPPGPYSIPQFASDAVGLLQALGIDQVNVVGISMGGMIAFQMAVDSPDLITSLAIVNSGPELVVRTVKDRFALWQRLLIVRLLGMRKMGEVVSKWLFPKPNQEEMRKKFSSRWAENDPKSYLETLRGMVGWSVSARLEQIKCPVISITADKDYTPIALKKEYVSRLPNAELAVIQDSRHGTPVDQPEAFNEVLHSFLKKHN